MARDFVPNMEHAGGPEVRTKIPGAVQGQPVTLPDHSLTAWLLWAPGPALRAKATGPH